MDQSLRDPLPDEWRNFELYEKVRVRENRKRFWILFLTGALFLGLCSVPVVQSRMPKWQSLDAARKVAFEMEQLKTDAIRERSAILFEFSEGGRFRRSIVQDCGSRRVVRAAGEGVLWPEDQGLKVLSRAELLKVSLKNGLDSVCFDPVTGLSGAKAKQILVIVPVKDLAVERLERASFVELIGESAKISIN